MEAPQKIYSQDVTQLTMPFFIRKDTEVEGALMLELANFFISDLVFPGCRLTGLWTKRPGQDRQLNMGEFTERRWKTTVKKILANQYAVVDIQAQTVDFPNQKIWFDLHVNPLGGDEFLISGNAGVKCSVSYLRHLATRPQMVEALLEFGKRVWNGIDGGPAYGYGNLAKYLERPLFDPRQPRPPGAPWPWEFIKPPADRVHAIPVAYLGDTDLNLAQSYCSNKGIKGAFWANFLNAVHVEMVGGADQIRAKLAGIRVESLNHGGLLIVATESPLPEDTEENRDRFLRVHTALQPAFLSYQQTTEMQRPLLSYFYRERPSILP
jgi:hypothetical protein